MRRNAAAECRAGHRGKLLRALREPGVRTARQLFVQQLLLEKTELRQSFVEPARRAKQSHEQFPGRTFTGGQLQLSDERFVGEPK